MTAAYRVIVAGRAEVSLVTVVCDECGLEVSLNIESARIPEGCASCGKQWDDNLKAALAGLARFQRMGKTAEEAAAKPIFRFHIRQTD